MNKNRPLSPHLSIHKKVLTSVFSISHRITGISLTLGSLLITVWIVLLAMGPIYFSYYEKISTNLIFKIILFIWTIGIFYHLFNGIRYLFWSLGWGMSLKTVYFSGYLVILLTFISTFIIWFF